MNIVKRHRRGVVVIAALAVLAMPAFAHVTVKPDVAGLASNQTFTISVPTEKDVATVGLRLVLPEGLESVRPNVKPGWTVELKKIGTGDSAKIVELVWTGGSIPAELRDEFTFRAKVPATATTLIWKAYQSYKDGEIVAWDADPAAAKVEKPHSHEPGKEEKDAHQAGPYSVTRIVDDLSPKSATAGTVAAPTLISNVEYASLITAIIAGLLSIVAIFVAVRRKGQ